MKPVCRKFVRLLEIELESMKEEINLFIETQDRRLASHEITDYVRNENCAFFRNELLGIENALTDKFEFTESNGFTLDDLATVAKGHFRKRISEKGFVPALMPLVDGRIDKIIAYLKLDYPVV